MRLWSIHPSYLDAKGLVALWRESLLAKKILHNKTRGYINHPQLLRFKNHPHPNQALSLFLAGIWYEARRRGYRFNRHKFKLPARVKKIKITQGQLLFEFRWLCGKLRHRCPKQWALVRRREKLRPHPLFRVVPGPVAGWEKSWHRG